MRKTVNVFIKILPSDPEIEQGSLVLKSEYKAGVLATEQQLSV